MKIRLLVAGLVFTATTAAAQQPDTATLATVVVSATKTPAERSSLTQPVTVITGAELRAQGIARVSDALRTVPGVAIAQNGSTGSVSTLFLRGGESRYTKVLIDGVAVNAPGGFFDFSHLTTDNIDRIEVVRGPAGVVHGADAMSGIVQIFTRQGRGPLSASAHARGGSRGSREVGVSADGATGRGRYSIGGGAQRTDGVYSFNNQYYNGTLSGSAGYSPKAGSDVLLTSRYSAAEFHYPTDFTGLPVDSNSYRVQHRLTVGIDASTRVSHAVSTRIKLGTNEVSDLTEDIGVPFGSTDALASSLMSRNKRRSGELGLTIALPLAATLNFGSEYMAESEKSVNEEGPVGGASAPSSSFSASRRNRAMYAELLGTVMSRLSYTFAARLDDNSDYEPFITYKAGATAPLGTTTRLHASFSTAFNAPAFNQIRPTLYTSASPNLDPESGVSWEIGGEQSLAAGAVTVAASYFNQSFKDMIQYVSGGPPDFLGSFDNLTEAESNGFELEARLTPMSEWSAWGSYAMARPRVKRVSSDYSGDLVAGEALLRRPEHSANAALSWSRKSIASLSANVTYSGERSDKDFSQFPAPTVKLSPYFRFDVAGSKDVFTSSTHTFGLTVRVENLFDKRYEDVLNFASPRRTILLGARYSGSL